jgi:hypothetical protein
VGGNVTLLANAASMKRAVAGSDRHCSAIAPNAAALKGSMRGAVDVAFEAVEAARAFPLECFSPLTSALDEVACDNAAMEEDANSVDALEATR